LFNEGQRAAVERVDFFERFLQRKGGVVLVNQLVPLISQFQKSYNTFTEFLGSFHPGYSSNQLFSSFAILGRHLPADYNEVGTLMPLYVVISSKNQTVNFMRGQIFNLVNGGMHF